jgi:hypothetical protein
MNSSLPPRPTFSIREALNFIYLMHERVVMMRNLIDKSGQEGFNDVVSTGRRVYRQHDSTRIERRCQLAWHWQPALKPRSTSGVYRSGREDKIFAS